jgi:hypothetical protein
MAQELIMAVPAPCRISFEGPCPTRWAPGCRVELEIAALLLVLACVALTLRRGSRQDAGLGECGSRWANTAGRMTKDLARGARRLDGRIESGRIAAWQRTERISAAAATASWRP